MSLKGTKFETYLKEQLKNPIFKKEWNSSELQYRIGREIIRLRLEQNISQRELAKKAQTTQAVISRIESLSENPSLKLVDKIATALGKRLEISFA